MSIEPSLKLNCSQASWYRPWW